MKWIPICFATGASELPLRLCKHFSSKGKGHKDTKETLVACAAGTAICCDNIFQWLVDANLTLYWCNQFFVSFFKTDIFCSRIYIIYIYSLIERCKSLCISEFEIISSPPDRWPANKVSFEACPNLWLGQKKYFRKKNISYMKGLQATKIIKGI